MTLQESLNDLQYGKEGSIYYCFKAYLSVAIVCTLLFSQLAAILPLAIVHTMANVFTNMSPGKVAVSFTHVDKAHRELKPATYPVLVPIFLGQVISISVQHIF